MAESKFSYEMSLKEIQTIMKDLTDGKVGIDQLEKKVIRAKELLQLCQQKLKNTQEELDKNWD